MDTNLEIKNKGGNKTEQRTSLTFCKWCRYPIHRGAVERAKISPNYCDLFCMEEDYFNRDLRNKFLGRYNLIDQDSIAEELKEKEIVNIEYAKDNNISLKLFSQYINHLERDGWVIEKTRNVINKKSNDYKLIKIGK